MKYLVLVVIIGCSFQGISQNIQTQSTKASEHKEAADEEQVEEFEKSADNELAATNLLLEYELLRNSSFQGGNKTLDHTTKDSLTSIANIIKSISPDSYSADLVSFKEEGYTEKGYSLLKQAEVKTYNKSELYSDLLAISHILDNQSELDNYSTKLRNSGFINSTTLEYNRNILRSIKESNAFLVTNGWEDTYPLLTLLKEEKKKNVTVINSEWVLDANYRASISKKLGVTNFDFNQNPYTWIQLVIASTNKHIYLAPSLPFNQLTQVTNQIVPVGLLFKKGALTITEQSSLCLDAWKKFSKVNILSNKPINKNYIILLTLLEGSLAKNDFEKETLAQVISYKGQLESLHPSLK